MIAVAEPFLSDNKCSVLAYAGSTTGSFCSPFTTGASVSVSCSGTAAAAAWAASVYMASSSCDANTDAIILVGMSASVCIPVTGTAYYLAANCNGPVSTPAPVPTLPPAVATAAITTTLLAQLNSLKTSAGTGYNTNGAMAYGSNNNVL